MSSSCYRCGATVEQQTTFCPSCGAPQIRVTVPAATANSPSTPPLPPGTPESVQPPAMPVSFGAPGQIQWRAYRRLAVPLSLLAGIIIAFVPPIGLLIFFGALTYCVNRYRREHPGPLSNAQGARFGAFNGLVSFVVGAALRTAMFHAEIRQQIIQQLQQRYAGNPDPQMQQLVQLLGTTQGFTIFMVLFLLFLFFIFLIVSSFAGALTVTLSGHKPDR